MAPRKKTTTLDFLPVRISALFKIVESFSGGQPIQKNDLVEVGRLRLHRQQVQVFWEETIIDLTLMEFWLLLELVENFGYVKSHDQLMAAANDCRRTAVPDFQLHGVLRSQTTISPHLGLGLYIVRTIVDHHHGTVRCSTSTDGRHKIFTVTF